MSATKTTDRDKGLKSLIKELTRNKGSNVTVGVHKGEGVTKSGAEIGSVGYWLDQGTKHMPARPWVRGTVDKFSKRYQNILKQNYSAVLLGRMTVKAALEDLGGQVKDDMRNFIISDQVQPETSEAVMATKASKKTLFETGKLVDAVHFRVNV